MEDDSQVVKLRIYIGLLALSLGAVLVRTAVAGGGFSSKLPYWIFLIVLYAVSEYIVLTFHHESERVGLSTAEAIFLPMMVGLTFPEAVWGVTVGAAAFAALSRLSGLKAVFNVAEFGLAAAVAAGAWQVLSDGSSVFSLRDVVAAVVCVAIFSLLTHIFTATVVALAEGRSFIPLLREVAGAGMLNLAGSIAIGLLFAASFVSVPWIVFLFPLPLAALFYGYRAMIRQEQEKKRLEYLHSASRALASSPDLASSLREFLSAMAEMVSASGARAVITSTRGGLWTGVLRGETEANLEDARSGPFLELTEFLRADPKPFILSEEAGDHAGWLTRMKARNLIVVPLLDDENVVGCLMAVDRVGAEDFGDRDIRLVESLANELVLTLDSYRLFAEVEEERERFQQIFAGSKEGICLLDQDGVIRAWNPALARITGFDEEDILGEKWSERVLVRDRHHRRVEGMDIITVPPDEELELVTRQGPPRWVSIMSGEVQSEDTKSWVVLVRDITREHELEESKSDFLSTISHELRTPLTTIKGSLQVLSRPNASANSEIGKQMIEIMKRGSDRLERLVMNLLAVSQMEAGDVQVYPDEVALEELVRSRIGTILVDHPEVDVVADEDVVVRADRERLSQAVEHLLDNARKFGPEAGPIRVEIVKENGFARLSISDEGPGIPKIDQERIFDRFVRLGHVLTRETQGPGVGLFIAKHSIEAMGGSIKVESEPNRGATFHVRVPLARPMAAIEPATSA